MVGIIRPAGQNGHWDQSGYKTKHDQFLMLSAAREEVTFSTP